MFPYEKPDLHKPSLFVTIGDTDQKEIVSPKSLCEVDGCYHTAINKLCKEHQMYTSMEYLIAHKPIQSPVAHSKYNFEQRGLACIQLQLDE